MPTYEEARVEAGQLFEKRNYVGCEILCDQVLGITLKDYWILGMLGSLHAMNKRHGHAILFFQRAILEHPGFSEGWNGLGISLRTIGHEEEARECYKRALEIEQKPEYWANLGGSYVNAGEPEKCIEYSKKAIELNPQFSLAANNMALALLEMGKWDEGFTAYQERKRTPTWSQRDYGCPEWDGKPTELLIVHGEQGLGDEIMFLTCIEDLRKVQPNIVIEASPRLVGLLRNTFDCPVYGTPEEVLQHHKPTAYIAMGDLGYWFRRDGSFSRKPYLKSSYTYPTGDRPRIGISWYGGKRETHSYARNFAVHMWKPVLENDAEFISLQYKPYGKGESDQLGISHDQEWIDDLDKLAARIKSCDLVISVCNTTVHMAGALGVPCFCFVPHRAAWRYGISGEKMPWYDLVKLYRQEKDQNWTEVIQRVKEDVGRLLAG